MLGRLAFDGPPLEWSYLEQLGFGAGYRVNSPLLMLQGHFDDSHAYHVSRARALGGGLAILELWHGLQPGWTAVIKESGREYFRGSEWHSDEAGLEQYWRQLIDIIHEYKVIPIGCVVPRRIAELLPTLKAEVYKAAAVIIPQEGQTRRQWAAFHTDPHSLCLSWCVYLALKTKRLLKEAELELIFAKTAKLAGRWERLETMLKRTKAKNIADGLGSHMVFNGNPRLIQFQIADLVAYELTANQDTSEKRWQYKELTKHGTAMFKIASRARLAPLWEPE